MSKKSYMSLLKEAIAEFDTSDTVEVKGPMLDPILSWDGDGELPVYKDAASILERYYFEEDQDKVVNTLDEADYENDNGKPDKGEAMKDAEGAGTEQAGTSKKGMDKHEEEIAKEAEEVDADDAEADDDVEEHKHPVFLTTCTPSELCVLFQHFQIPIHPVISFLPHVVCV